MRTNLILIRLALTMLCIGAIGTASASEGDENAKSPYFQLSTDNGRLEQFPLKSSNIDVSIDGVIAEVRITQQYQNTGQSAINAIYVFPAGTRAAIHHMEMQIGDRRIVAKVQERIAARKAFNQAKQSGQSASLLEQHRPNVFQMSVANILPGDAVQVTLHYTELIESKDHIYEFVYPAVVGPRFAEGKTLRTDNWTRNPYLKKNAPMPYQFGLRIKLNPGMAVQDISSPSHQTEIRYGSATTAIIEPDRAMQDAGNRDFILRYRLADQKIQTGLVLQEGANENHFLLMLQPPARVSTDLIVPREYIFVVDVSGSMRGFPLEISKTLMRDLLTQMRPVDRFNLILFAGSNQSLSPHTVPANQENILRAVDLLDSQRGGGGTRLIPALERALGMGDPDEGLARSVVIVSDGYIAVEQATFDLIRSRMGQANVFAFGIGTSVNRHLIEGIAHVGKGEPFVATQKQHATKVATDFRQYVSAPVLTNIRIDFDGFDVYDVEPAVLPDVFANRPVMLYGKWRGKRQGTIRLTGQQAGSPYQREFKVRETPIVQQSQALRYLWARKRLQELSDYGRSGINKREIIDEVTRIGLQYNLLTQHTSFIAIDPEQRNLQPGNAVTIAQPLPLPHGVEEDAAAPAPRMRSYSGISSGGVSPLSSSSAADQSVALPSLVKKAREVGSLHGQRAEKEAPPLYRVEFSDVRASGNLKAWQVQSLLRSRSYGFARLADSAAGAGNLPSKMSVTLEIDKDGRVIAATCRAPGDTAQALMKIFESKFKGLRFSASGSVSQVSFFTKIIAKQ